MAEMNTKDGLVVGLILPEALKEDSPAESPKETPETPKIPTKGKHNDTRR